MLGLSLISSAFSRHFATGEKERQGRVGKCMHSSEICFKIAEACLASVKGVGGQGACVCVA